MGKKSSDCGREMHSFIQDHAFCPNVFSFEFVFIFVFVFIDVFVIVFVRVKRRGGGGNAMHYPRPHSFFFSHSIVAPILSKLSYILLNLWQNEKNDFFGSVLCCRIIADTLLEQEKAKD